MYHYQFHKDQINEIARQVISVTSNYRIWKFEGGMGAGKTTFIAALVSALGSADQTGSPTFSLVNEYIYPEGKIYHFDFYRIHSEQEALDLGIYDYLDSGQYCFIEWPSCIPEILRSEPGVILQLEIGSDEQERLLSIILPE